MGKAIKVEGLSKAYQLGQFSTGTLSRDIERWWASVRGKEDPFLKIGESNDRSKKGNSDIVMSLKDINFEIDQGEAVGIIGRNGAGKSTLLKVLSQVTTPTTGSIKVKGRIASLLEVGTGFHPELTGKENIYLNGAILGMRKAEVKRKFDEIVHFAGVERYIDTPVKRYSSGMYVRLAFAVAAHLESEILIVDEVLAVGDAEFQNKCLGKMKDVSGHGKTVLFVSHNMALIQQLCSKGLLLTNGVVGFDGSINETISRYKGIKDSGLNGELLSLKRSDNLGIEVAFSKVALYNADDQPTSTLLFGEPFSLELQIVARSLNINNLNVGVRFESDNEVYIASCLSGEADKYFNIEANSTSTVKINFSEFKLVPGKYFITFSIRSGKQFLDQLSAAFTFTVDTVTYGSTLPHSNTWGLVHFVPEWSVV